MGEPLREFKLRLKDIVHFPTPEVLALNPHIKNVLDAKKIPPQVQFHLGDIGEWFDRALANYQKQRMKLFQEHGTEVMLTVGVDLNGKEVKEPTGKFSLPSENLDSFVKAHAELLDSEIVVPLRPIRREELGNKVEGTCPADFIACRAFILKQEPPPLTIVQSDENCS